MSNQLVVDIGNTRVKVALFQGEELTDLQVFDAEDKAIDYVQQVKFQKAILCSVGKHNEEKWRSLGVSLFSHNTHIPLVNTYGTPETLGLDRLAAAIGAAYLFPQKEVLVIDCGTCITYDYVNANNEYVGGGISPGLDMKFKALNNFTERLPLVEKKNNVGLIGKTTEDSLLSGVINGTIAEISAIIKEYTKISDNLAPVLCGGDATFIANHIMESNISVEPNLVLKGLNRVLIFHA